MKLLCFITDSSHLPVKLQTAYYTAEMTHAAAPCACLSGCCPARPSLHIPWSCDSFSNCAAPRCRTQRSMDWRVCMEVCSGSPTTAPCSAPFWAAALGCRCFRVLGLALVGTFPCYNRDSVYTQSALRPNGRWMVGTMSPCCRSGCWAPCNCP